MLGSFFSPVRDRWLLSSRCLSLPFYLLLLEGDRLLSKRAEQGRAYDPGPARPSCAAINLYILLKPLRSNLVLYQVAMSEAFSLEAFIFVIILIIYIFTSHIIESRKVPYLHESTIAIVMGVFTAVFAKYGLNTQIQFSNEIFFAIILPPIIFSAGYSLRKSLFFENFSMIWFLGVVGTIIGFICLTAVIIALNSYIFKALTLTEIMMISSVLCATDTIAAINLIKPDRFPVLNAVLFGEGIINDAVAIILFRAISQLNIDETSDFTLVTVMEMAVNFAYLFFFSVAFGTVTGFGLSYLFKQFQSFNKHSIKETSLILLNGYFTYLMGELLGISGIISLFTCAIIMGHYCFMNISEESQRGTGLAFETVSYIAQAFVYSYLGASVLSIDGKWAAVVMAFMILLSMPFIRAIMVYTLPLIYKLLNKPFLMDSKELKVCWFSGLVRGVIAFALCLQIESKDKKYIITVALVVVIVTTILGSSLIKSFLKRVGLLDTYELQNEEEVIASFRQEKLTEAEPQSNYKSIGSLNPYVENMGSLRAESFAEHFQKIEEQIAKPSQDRSRNAGSSEPGSKNLGAQSSRSAERQSDPRDLQAGQSS